MSGLLLNWPSRWLLGEGRYGRAHLKADVMAGLTVALVLIPQSMAYAQLAGLPFYYGLYAAFLPPAVAALLGSSRQLATGPVAVVSLMTAAALEPLAVAGSEAFIAAAVLLSLLVGAIQLAVGVLRLGVLVNLLSHPVINGFTNAAALIIASAQLGKLFGVTVSTQGSFFTVVGRTLITATVQMHRPTLFMGLLAVGIMVGLKRLAPRSPGILVAVVLTTLLSWLTGFADQARVTPGAILHPPFHQALDQYNQAHTALDTAAQQRSRLQASLKTAAESVSAETRIEMQRELALSQLAEERAAAQLKALRETLGQTAFHRAAGTPEPAKFYENNNIPIGVDVAPRPWRLTIGSGPLDKDGLILKSGGAVVGDIPGGLPPIGLPTLAVDKILTLLPYAFIIALLGFMEAISIAKAMAAKTGQRIEPNRELVGQGIGNLVGACSASFPCAGSFSRSAVNLQAGAQSAVASAVTSLAVLLTLLFFTPVLYHLPQSVLAAVIMMAVVGLINIRGFLHTWRAQWFDGAISVITFCATLWFAPHLDKGILMGVVLSLLVFLFRSMRPTVVDLSLGVDHALHDAVANGLAECRYIDAVRFDGLLFFANASYLEDQIRRRRRRKKELKHIIIAAAGINDMDASGQEMLALIVDRVRSAGIDISLAGVNRAVLQVLQRTHLLAKIGADHIYPSMEQAITAIHGPTHRGGSEAACPLRTVCAKEGDMVGKPSS
jgi:MFS superfamily sulfate permease-like transporter